MERILERIMTYLAATAYAEAGDFDAVRAMINEKRTQRKRDKQQKRPSSRLTAPRSI